LAFSLSRRGGPLCPPDHTRRITSATRGVAPSCTSKSAIPYNFRAASGGLGTGIDGGGSQGGVAGSAGIAADAHFGWRNRHAGPELGRTVATEASLRCVLRGAGRPARGGFLECRSAPGRNAPATGLFPGPLDWRNLARAGTQPASHPLHGHHKLSLARSDVALQQHNLLPSAQHGHPVAYRYGDRGSQQRGLKMRVGVTVVPGAFVQIVLVGRNEPIHQRREILLKPRLKLNRAHRSSTTHHMHMGQSFRHAGATHDSRYVIR